MIIVYFIALISSSNNPLYPLTVYSYWIISILPFFNYWSLVWSSPISVFLLALSWVSYWLVLLSDLIVAWCWLISNVLSSIELFREIIYYFNFLISWVFFSTFFLLLSPESLIAYYKVFKLSLAIYNSPIILLFPICSYDRASWIFFFSICSYYILLFN